jgi:uncharacterized protein (DUF1778 family)
MDPYESRKESDARSARIELRAQPAREARIRYAAKLQNKSVSAFVLEAATEKAEDVIAATSVTVLPADFFDQLMAALDEPSKPMPRLARAAKSPRRFTQGK